MELWSWFLGLVGAVGFILAGKKYWWAWYVNLANQAFWLMYSLVTHQYGFLVATGVYTVVFTKNAIAWTKEREKKVKAINTPIPEGLPDKLPEEWRPFPANDGQYINVGPEAFATPDTNIIFYRGMNYYRACDAVVYKFADQGSSYCTKRVDHPGNYHEDYDGKLKLAIKPVILRDNEGRFVEVKE